VDAGTNICVTGFFYGTVAFGTANFTSAGFDDLFLFKLGAAPRPLLAAIKSGDNIRLSWPTWATNFSLESTEQISNAMTWVTITTTSNSITLPKSGGQKFFRLKKP
jgi:hypothetical protein